MEMRILLTFLQKWAGLVLAAALVAAGSSYLACRAATPLYRTQTTLMIGRVTQDPDPKTAELSAGQQLAYTYIQLARRQPVLEGALQDLGLQGSWQALAGQVQASIIPQTQLIEIAVVDSDPARAAALAGAIARRLILQGPPASQALAPGQLAFSQAQLRELQRKIEDGEAQRAELQARVDAANSAHQLQELHGEVDLLDAKLDGWRESYTGLLLFLQDGQVNTLSVVADAPVPSRPVHPNTPLTVSLAAVTGALLAVAGGLLVEHLDDSVKTAGDVQRLVGLPVLGSIPTLAGPGEPKLPAVQQPSAPEVEAFRALRAGLQFASLDRPLRTLLMTSPSPGEGKSLLLANLAVVLAQSGRPVILVDADLRQPRQHVIFRLPNEQGLCEAILQDPVTVECYLQAADVHGLRILTSGVLPPNPFELLGSGQMRALVAALHNQADIVLFDSPPARLFADAAMLGAQLDGVLLAAYCGRTRSADLCRVVEALQQARANLAGVVLNRAAPPAEKYYQKYYGKKM